MKTERTDAKTCPGCGAVKRNGRVVAHRSFDCPDRLRSEEIARRFWERAREKGTTR